MGAAVEDVHHRHRQGLSVAAADVVVQRQAQSLCSSLGNSQGYAEDSVCAELGLVRGAVSLDHSLVDCLLVESVHADNNFSDLAVYSVNSLEYALAVVAGLVAVTQLASLEDTGGSTGRNSSAAHVCAGVALNVNLNLNGRVAAGVHNFAADYINNFNVALHNSFSFLHKNRLAYKRVESEEWRVEITPPFHSFCFTLLLSIRISELPSVK